MAQITWLAIIAMCIAPALIMFICAGVVSIYKHAIAWKLSKREEVDHEL